MNHATREHPFRNRILMTWAGGTPAFDDLPAPLDLHEAEPPYLNGESR
jgi:hypothetical protein